MRFKPLKSFLPILLLLLAVVPACKKKSPQPDEMTQMKNNFKGEWEMTKTSYTEYDQAGAVSFTDNKLPGPPAPWYDFRNGETLYRSDNHGREAIRYTLSLNTSGTSSIQLAETSWDISQTYTITKLTANEMVWVQDKRFTDGGPNTLSRVYIEHVFAKR